MQDVSFGLGGLVCLGCVSAVVLSVFLPLVVEGFGAGGRWIFNQAVQTDASSEDGDLVHEQALGRCGRFGGVAG
ncbi:hypothetical protein BW686_19345 [Pseudomonas syringae]|uniref:Uncharacterized protein n=1 Tax=Pseudomonas syringae TaxID=317 RepID=A0A244EN09_PSESX|nr:hypothetical protein BW686_19345 [Pseudomonas syringae]